MINEVTIEGIVTCEPWTYDNDVFFRIVSYRDMDMLVKPDCTNIGYPGGAGTMFSIQKGQQVIFTDFCRAASLRKAWPSSWRRPKRIPLTVRPSWLKT